MVGPVCKVDALGIEYQFRDFQGYGLAIFRIYLDIVRQLMSSALVQTIVDKETIDVFGRDQQRINVDLGRKI